MKFYFTLLFLFFIGPAFSQTFAALDEDTHEFVEANYTTFRNKKPVSNGVTFTDKLTMLKTTDFDSISFTRLDYRAKGYRKETLSDTVIVYLKKTAINLDEVVITDSRKNRIVLGEKNRFIKSRANAFGKELDEAVIFRNETDKNLTITGAAVFINKVKFKTLYTINFYKVQESMVINGNQDIRQQQLVYTTDTLSLMPGTKGKVEIDIMPGYSLQDGDALMASVALIDYYDTSGNVFLPENDDLTKLNFQLSDKTDYYAKLIDLHTKELTKNLRNINLQTNYDFANGFHKKPHKSLFVAPAILLYARNE